MSHSHARFFSLIALLTVPLIFAGCVERIMKIDSDPQGARVFVNDREVGVTPIKFSFLWYGDYDIILRRDGFETLKTNYRVNAPWYQYPPFDLVAECLIPTMIRDEHVLPTYELQPAPTPEIPAVVERAIQAREQALAEEPLP
jgi:hypothetical protein